MNRMIRWTIGHTPAMNTLFVGVIAVGVLATFMLRREVFPEFELEIVLVNVPYPGASPEEVEDGICQKIEEAVRSIDGIKKQAAVAKEGLGSMVLELETSADPEKVLNEVRSEIDRISTFPLLSEDPEVKQVTMREAAILVGVVGPEQSGLDAELALRELAESTREDLIRLESVSQANISGEKAFQIDVEIPEETLQEYGLTLQSVAQIIRRENVELPGGTIKTNSQDVLVKGDNKGLNGEQIAQLPLVTLPSGAVRTVGDLARVKDGFADVTSKTYIDGKPAMVISVDRTTDEDLLAMTASVQQYVKEKQGTLPAGYSLVYFADRSIDVQERMDLLVRNGLQGLVLVLIVLALFLNVRLAIWVSLGIPISILGACAVLIATGQTLNMLTMFAFLMALGIVVDDAIVIGENIAAHREMSKNFVQAAIDGATEVLPSVVASIATTVLAFMPLFFVSGVMGKFIACLPLAMIAMLVISLLESTFILPCHLAHEHQEGLCARARALRQRWSGPLYWTVGPLFVGLAFLFEQLLYPLVALARLFEWFRVHATQLLGIFTDRIYLPALRFSLSHIALTLSFASVLLLVAFGLVRGGHVPFIIFPKLDSKEIASTIKFPDGTPESVTAAATLKIERAIRDVDKRHTAEGGVLKLVRRNVGIASQKGMPGQSEGSQGSHIGSVSVELRDTADRNVTSEQIIAEWRETSGEFAGAESVTFASTAVGPGGTPIEFKLLARSTEIQQLEAAVEKCKAKLGSFPGVFDITDDATPGKWEYRLKIKDDAVAMGIPLSDLAETVRASYFGEEVMRLQRGRHEVKLMVRYPAADRRSLADFEDIRVRTTDGAERPLTELADVSVTQGPSEINRVDQLRSITISADVDESQANAAQIVRTLKQTYMPTLLAEHPSVTVRWEGQQEQTQESISSLIIGLAIALLCMFALLTFEFRSYIQPMIIMGVIPFGAVGAIVGHWLLHLPLTLFSLFGLVALTGVVVNDSIVLVDFINQRMRDGLSVRDALIDAGRRRLRPVLLTSITTVAGLLPLLLEQSFQAQILIPMAVSLAFGLILGTVLVLFLVPVFYAMYAHLVGRGHSTIDDDTKNLQGSPQQSLGLDSADVPGGPQPVALDTLVQRQFLNFGLFKMSGATTERFRETGTLKPSPDRALELVRKPTDG